MLASRVSTAGLHLCQTSFNDQVNPALKVNVAYINWFIMQKSSVVHMTTITFCKPRDNDIFVFAQPLHFLTMVCFSGTVFEGFEFMENKMVMVRRGQAVGLHCGYVGTPVPAPEVTWLKDQVPITINTIDKSPHYRVLDKGELVIYNLKMSDIMTGNESTQYRCRVDNARKVEKETAPFFYTLYENEDGEFHKIN